MSLWASLKRAATVALQAVIELIERPIDACLRPFESFNRERDAITERVLALNERLQQRRDRARPPPASPPPIRPGWRTQNEVSTGRFAQPLADISKELDRVIRQTGTDAFKKAGGTSHPYLDHLKLISDVGLDQAVEISGYLTQLGDVRPWDFFTRPGDAAARAELLLHLEEQGWWRRARSREVQRPSTPTRLS